MNDPELVSGTFLGRYRVKRLIGRGGMGEVYEGYDDTLRRSVALKVLRSALVDHSERLRRFVQEARSASALSHPHIVTIYEIGETQLGGRPTRFIAMEFIDGKSLRQLLEGIPPPAVRLLRILIDVADGLAAAHGRGIIHRDLKPANIMVDREARAKIVDFGLAKLTAPDHEGYADSQEETDTLTREGGLLGTVGYIAPEQIEHRGSDHRSDIFSFGCILYEAVTGRRAFGRGSDVDVLYRVVHEAPPPIESVRPDVPLSLQRIVKRCLEKLPQDRYASMKDVAFDLRDAERDMSSSGGRSDHSAPAARVRVGRLSRAAAVSVFALAIIPAAVIFLSYGHRSPPLLQALVTWPSNEYDCNISPDRQWISFISTRSGRPAIYLRRRAGGEPMMLVDRPAEIGSHTWSPDSDYIAYLTVSDGVPYIQVIPAFGGAPEKSSKLPESFRNARVVRWIGTRTYVESDGLWAMDTTTGTLSKLVPGGSPEGRRSWFDVRRDARRVAFTVTGRDRSCVWTADMDGSDPKQLTDAASTFSDYSPRFGGSSDQYLYFSSNRSGQFDIWRTRLFTGGTEQITFSTAVEWVEDVASDGSFLVSMESRDGSDLWLIDSANGDQRQVTADAMEDRWPRAARTGLVAFQRNKPAMQQGLATFAGEILVGEIRGTELRNERVAVASAGLPQVSQDGQWIIYVRNDSAKRYELWAKDLRSEHEWRISAEFKIPSLYPFPSDWLGSNIAWKDSSTEVFFIRRTTAGEAISAADLRAPNSREIIRFGDGVAVHDLVTSRDGAALAYVKTSTGAGAAKRSDVVVRQLATGRERSTFELTHDWHQRLFCRGWTVSGELLVLVAHVNADWTEEVEAVLIAADGRKRAMRLAPRAFGGASRYDDSCDSLLMTTVDDDGSHNVTLASLGGGATRRLTNNRLPGISFAAYELLAGSKVLLTRQERNSDLWLIEFDRKERANGR